VRLLKPVTHVSSGIKVLDNLGRPGALEGGGRGDDSSKGEGF